jgi:hypothetical protein
VAGIEGRRHALMSDEYDCGDIAPRGGRDLRLGIAQACKIAAARERLVMPPTAAAAMSITKAYTTMRKMYWSYSSRAPTFAVSDTHHPDAGRDPHDQ